MRSPNSVFNGKYFTYSLLRILPYGAIMAAILSLFDVLFFGVNKAFFGGAGLNADALSGCAPFFLVIMPVLIAIGLFNFLHKQKKSDFFGSMPIKRTSLFLTNIVVGVVLIASILLVNLLTMSVIVKTVYPGAAAAFPAFIYSYFAMLAGWLAVFSIASFCATLTGGIISQLALTALVLYLPTALAVIFQYPVLNLLSNSSYALNGSVHINTLTENSLFFFPSFYTSFNSSSSAFGMLFGVGASQSTNIYTEIWRIAYNFLLFIVFSAVGALFMKKRAFETAERPFVKEIFTDIVLGLMFFPFAFIAVATASDTIIIIGLVIIFFFIASLVLRKGFRKIWRAAISLTICMIVAVSSYFILDFIRMSYDKNNPFEKNIVFSDISQAEIYIAPLDVVGSKCVPVKVNAKTLNDILSAFDSNVNNEYYNNYNNNGIKTLIKTSDGKSYTGYFDISQSGLNKLYSYIEKNPEILEKLESVVQKPSLCLSVTSSSGNISLEKPSSEKVNNILAERRKISVSERYSRLEKYSNLGNYSRISSMFYNGYNGDENMEVINYRYYNGMYFYDYYSFEDVAVNKDVVEKIEKVSNKYNIDWKSLSSESLSASFIGDMFPGDSERSEMFKLAVSGAVSLYGNEIFNDIKKAENRYTEFNDLVCLNIRLVGNSYNQVIKPIRLFVDYSDFIEKYVDIVQEQSLNMLNSYNNDKYMHDLALYKSAYDYETVFITEVDDFVKLISEKPELIVSYKSSKEALADGYYRIMLNEGNNGVTLFIKNDARINELITESKTYKD
ncbi:MAG: hypothetical protein DBX47_02445 [Clostridiales bacterium]|nr:MAG: hypothetical protein DBX47_02445 [Clostridiales bacterium]